MSVGEVRRRRGGCGQKDPAGRFFQYVLSSGADLSRLGGADAAKPGAAFDLRRGLAADHDRLRAVTAGGFDDAGADAAGAHDLGRHPDVLVLLSHVAGALQRPLGLLLDLRRELGVERQGQRHFDHVDEIEAGLSVVPL
jgi:hypothetical protein